MRAALEANGVSVTEHDDGLSIDGTGGEAIPGGGCVATQLDHRIAMSMTVASLGAARAITLDDASPVATSYPTFFASLDALAPLEQAA